MAGVLGVLLCLGAKQSVTLLSAANWRQVSTEATECGCLGPRDELRSPSLFVSIWSGPGRRHMSALHLGLFLHSLRLGKPLLSLE